MRIKLRHLEVFTALFEAGSVSRAAERLSLSQPAVSIALSHMEEELGFRLFHRDRGFFAPTSEALLLHDEVLQGLAAIGRVDQRAAEIRSGAAGSIVVGTNGAMALNFLPGIIAEFQRDFPGTHVELRVHSSRRIASWVSNGQVDIGLMDAPVPVGGLSTEVFEMECMCILPKADPLASKAIITPIDLDGRAVIAFMGDHPVDRQLGQAMADAGAVLNPVSSATFYAIARSMVAAGAGIALIDPVHAVAELNDGVVARRFAPGVLHEQAMVTARGVPMGIAASQFQNRLREALSGYGRPR
ncbi:MAG: LysR substrate-binding domain-containing protein [Roseovarius sp.]